jgi:F-type H+-transporting ATPase subunit a
MSSGVLLFSPKHLLMSKFFFFIFSFLSLSVSAAPPTTDEPFRPGEMITHHITDSHMWHFWDGPGGTLYLPVIVYGRNGLEMFSSSNFYDEDHQAVPYRGYVLDHGHIYYADQGGDPNTLMVQESHAHKDGPMDFSITKNVASLFISVALLFGVFLTIARRYQTERDRAPRGVQSFFEPIILFIRDDIAKPNIGPKYERFMPYLLTIFFFIWFNNLLGLLPGGANLTGNIGVTLILALFTFVIILINSNKAYWGHIFNTPGVPWWLKWGIPIMPIVEVMGVFTRPFSLMVRLFANITAGHIIILSLFSLIFIFKSFAVGPLSVAFATFMYFLELFVAILQAFIFTLLSAMYFGMAVEEHADHSHEAAEAHH